MFTVTQLLARETPPQVCRCHTKTLRDGTVFYWHRVASCPVHQTDWRRYLEATAKLLPTERVKLDCGDIEGRFGRIA